MSARTYLDWNATAPLRPEARAAVAAALDAAGNPSSVHREGRAARRLIELARQEVAALVGGDLRHVVFTSGATEANMLALTPGCGCGHLIVSAIEHPSVQSGGRFPATAVHEFGVTPDGIADLSDLERRLAEAGQCDGGPPLVSVMAANNETGVLQPVREIADMVHAAGGLLHVDAVQVAGRIPFDINSMEVDLLSISSHKLGGPMGAGAVVHRLAAIDPQMRGGGQERGARAGTENVAGIAGFGAAVAAARDDLASGAARMRFLRDRLEGGLKQGPVTIFGEAVERLPNTTLFAAPGIKAETALIGLDLAGFAVSSGSACSSGKVAASHVLLAMGVAPDLVSGAIRVSLGPTTAENEIDLFLEAWRKLAAGLSRDKGGLAA